jgi:hypothetical protein
MQNFKYQVGISFSAGEPWLTFMHSRRGIMPKAKTDTTPFAEKTDEFSTKYLNKVTNGAGKLSKNLTS